MTQIKILTKSETKNITVRNGESLMSALIRENFYISTPCGGKGNCGKCKIKVTDGNAPISTQDRKFFTQKELDDGMRLSCTLYPDNSLTVKLNSDSENRFEIIGDYYTDNFKKIRTTVDSSSDFKAAIDIGTTTIVFRLIDSVNNSICRTHSKINHQRQFGADVISRIQASNVGKSRLLREIIKSDLQNGISDLCAEYKIKVSQISKIAIAANTAMTHLLMGYDCHGLGAYPFRPFNTDFIKGSAADIIGIRSQAETIVFPPVSAFVGGDIVSGMYACGFSETDDISLLIDLGTNGEMAIGNRNKIFVSSVAAGPAFEGGNISCGTPSIDGAVCAFNLNGDTQKITTIGGKSPIGICGTGCIEITAELLRMGLIDKTGLLSEKYFEKGFPVEKTDDGINISFTQNDIRQIQLAKGAVRAGTEILIKRFGILPKDISRIYIAGGFGYRLNIEKASYIGMLPENLTNRIYAVGNSSLGGAVKYLSHSSSDYDLKKLTEVCSQIDLALDDEFSQSYLNYMSF